jgi:drug/metabolite transporter (DMT)-like permease
VPLHALVLVLAAAASHAIWNTLLAGRKDIQAATVAALICGLVAFAPAVIATWSFTAAAWPWLIGSSVLQLGYFLVLTYAYQRFELSLVYPVARGLAPVLVLVVGTAFLGVGATALQVAGVIVVSSGVLLVRRREKGQLHGVALGALIACAIMGSTLIDREGIQHAGTIPFFWLAFMPSALAGGLLRRRELRASFDRRTFVVGVAMFGGYALYLFGLRISPPHAAQATRESSIAMTTLLAAVVLKERVTARRWTGVAVVLAGVALIALS